MPAMANPEDAEEASRLVKWTEDKVQQEQQKLRLLSQEADTEQYNADYDLNTGTTSGRTDLKTWPTYVDKKGKTKSVILPWIEDNGGNLSVTDKTTRQTELTQVTHP